jgi:hypothetical protein
MKPFLSIVLMILIMEFPLISRSFPIESIMISEKYFTVHPDTIIYRDIQEINVYPQVKQEVSPNQYSRMVKKIRKVYPFAKEAALEMQVYNEKFKLIDNPRLKRKYINKVEKELFAKHTDDMKHLTISEGRYLMLLIDREIGETPYELVKELKGSFSAAFWQGLAKVFSNDLKEEYDPVYKHYMIEQIVLMIEKENS